MCTTETKANEYAKEETKQEAIIINNAVRSSSIGTINVDIRSGTAKATGEKGTEFVIHVIVTETNRTATAPLATVVGAAVHANAGNTVGEMCLNNGMHAKEEIISNKKSEQ